MTWQYYHTVWLVMVLSWITNYAVRVGIAPALIPIMAEFNLTHAQAGLLATAFFYAYTAMQLPAGHLGDRFGQKVILVAAIFWWGLMSLATGFARSFTMIFSTRFLTGAGQGCFFSNDRPIITAYTPRDKMGLGQGVSFMGLGIGMTLGMLLAGVIIDAFGWRYVFIFYSIPCFIAGTLIAIVIKQPKREVMRSDPVKRASYRLIFKNRDLWLLYASGIAAIYVLWVLGTWTPKMFQEIGVKKLAAMATFSSLLGIAGVPGLLITGLVSDALLRRGIGRKIVIATEYVALAILMVLIGYAVQVKASVTILSILVFLAGFFVWGIWAPMYALIPELVPREILGTTYGLTNTFHFTGSLLSPWLTGWIRDVTGSFAWGAYLAGAFIFISALVLMGMRPVYRLGPDVPIKVT